MDVLTTMRTREIIKDFADEISKKKEKGPPPAKAVIKFRNDAVTNRERDIYLVPIELLRFRKDNGRISSDVLNYEKSHGLLQERSKDAQDRIRQFLDDKDKDKTKELYSIIMHDGQREPAIITCDGFLINGNRRKLVMEKLHGKFPNDSKFSHMKVVILPGESDEGGPPTLLEIEQIENRYQLQSEGKAEYYAFDRALSMRRKIECGMSLKEQLQDDPSYAALDEKSFKKALQDCKKDYLGPLDCINSYLCSLDREELYSTVSTGLGDPQGRWQAFRDYYNFVYLKLMDEKSRIKLAIPEDEVGAIEDAAFKIIRMRELSGLPKVHMVVREMAKWLGNAGSRLELIKLQEVPGAIAVEERFDEKGKEYDEREVDRIWSRKYKTKVTKHVMAAKYSYEHRRERETPLNLMEDALKKLNHENLKPSEVAVSDHAKAMRIARAIQERANELETEFYSRQKKWKEFAKKHGRSD